MEHDIFNMVTGWLVIYGLAFMMANTDGPFNLFTIVREKIDSTTKREWIRTGVSCQICISFWVGMPVAWAMDGGWVMWLSAVGFTCAITSLSPGDSEDDEESED